MRRLGAALVLVLAANGPAAAQTSPAAQTVSPTEQLSAYTDQMLQLLQGPGFRELDTPDKLHTAVRKTVIRMFGVSEAAREALGPHWQARTPAERDDFVELFADLLEAIYVAQLNRPGGVRLRYTGEQIQGDRAEVLLTVRTGRGSEVKTQIRLLQKGERWLIWDVAIEGVSLIQTYRAQFDRVIKRGSYPDLVRQIRTKIDDLYRAKG
ncbi:MAG: MlaC/ttg2D family ABC transporter substrate-binding protein [Candidatus Rokuibacteriota bacterium]